MIIFTVEFTHMGESHTRILFGKEDHAKWLERHKERVVVTSTEEEEIPDKEIYDTYAQQVLDNPEDFGLI